MKKHIALLFTILIVLGLCACSLEEISNTNPVDAVDVVGDMIKVDKTAALDISEQDMAEPSAASGTDSVASAEESNVLTTDAAVNQEPSESPANVAPPQITSKETELPQSGEPQTKQKTPTPSEQTTPKTEQPAETTKSQELEPSAPSESEKPSTPKTAYDYEFDINQIRNNLIALAKGYGLTLDESLNKNNACWANPVAATENTQGDLLKRLLNESVQYYADKDFRASMGLSNLGLTVFNIYCESLGNGEYRIYFLNY